MNPAESASAVGQQTPATIIRRQLRRGTVRFAGRRVLLDLEGTLISRSYVKDVLWPHARRNLAAVLRANWFDASVARIREKMARDAGGASFEQWCKVAVDSAEAFVRLFDEVLRLSHLPMPTQAFAELVELTWLEGYRKGALKTHVYPDVVAALESWSGPGRSLHTFSRIGIPVQCAMLAKTEKGNLLGCFSEHHDSQTGPKNAPGSFCTISDELRLHSPGDMLFVGDDPPELDAARIAGVATVFVQRPGNPPPPRGMLHPVVTELRSILLG